VAKGRGRQRGSVMRSGAIPRPAASAPRTANRRCRCAWSPWWRSPWARSGVEPVVVAEPTPLRRSTAASPSAPRWHGQLGLLPQGQAVAELAQSPSFTDAQRTETDGTMVVFTALQPPPPTYLRCPRSRRSVRSAVPPPPGLHHGGSAVPAAAPEVAIEPITSTSLRSPGTRCRWPLLRVCPPRKRRTSPTPARPPSPTNRDLADLKKQTTYFVRVRALAADGEPLSDWSSRPRPRPGVAAATGRDLERAVRELFEGQGQLGQAARPIRGRHQGPGPGRHRRPGGTQGRIPAGAPSTTTS